MFLLIYISFVPPSAAAAFHERVGMQELVRHEFVDDDPLVQRSVFADGTAVTCDFHTQTYRITDCPHH